MISEENFDVFVPCCNCCIYFVSLSLFLNIKNAITIKANRDCVLYWAVSSESGYDKLTIIVNSTPTPIIKYVNICEFILLATPPLRLL